MQVIDVDSHITVVKGLEDSPFQIKMLPDGGHLMEFSGTRLDFTPPQGKMPRPHKPPIDMRTWWDLDRRLGDLDQGGCCICRKVKGDGHGRTPRKSPGPGTHPKER